MPRLWRIVREGIRKFKKTDKERERERERERGSEKEFEDVWEKQIQIFVEIKLYLGFCR